MYTITGRSETAGAGSIKWISIQKGKVKEYLPFPVFEAVLTLGISDKVLFLVQNTPADFLAHLFIFVIRWDKSAGKWSKYRRFCRRNDF